MAQPVPLAVNEDAAIPVTFSSAVTPKFRVVALFGEAGAPIVKIGFLRSKVRVVEVARALGP